MPRAVLSLVFLLAAGAACRGADAAAEQTGNSFVHDTTRLFSDEDRAAIERHLAAAQRVTGVTIRIEATGFREGQSAREIATGLANSLPGAPPALVIAFVRGSAQSACVAGSALWQRYPADSLAILLAETTRIIAAQTAPPEQRFREAAELAVARLRSLEAVRRARRNGFGAAERRLLMLVSGAFLAGAAIFGGVVAARKKRSAELAEPLAFPEVEVGSRLGAPFGGGAIGEAESHRSA